jgi:hypothetical protein
LLPLFVVALLPMLAMVGLALDFGHFYWNRTRLQNSIDAAALTAAKTLNDKRGSNIAGGGPTIQAISDAQNIFLANQGAAGNLELYSDSTGNDPYFSLGFEFSRSLPFVSSANDPRFVRVTLPSFRQSYWFLQVLNLIDPGVGADIDAAPSGISAVAGPSPTLSCPANIVPLIVCDKINNVVNNSNPPVNVISPSNILRLGSIASGYKSSLCVGDTIGNAAAPIDIVATTPLANAPIRVGLNTRMTSTAEFMKSAVNSISGNLITYNGYTQYKNVFLSRDTFDAHPRIMTLPVVNNCDASGNVSPSQTTIIRFDCFFLANTFSVPSGLVPPTPSTWAIRVPADTYGNRGCLNQGTGMGAQVGSTVGDGPHTIILY